MRYNKLTKLNLIILIGVSLTISISAASPSVYAAPNLDTIVVSPQTPDQIIPGENATYYVVVTRGEVTDAFEATLSITSGLPPGVSASLDPVTVSFPQDDLLPQFSLLTVTSSNSTQAVDDYLITIQATNSGADISTGNCTLTIISTTVQTPHKSHHEIFDEQIAEQPIIEELPPAIPVENTPISNLRAIPVSQSIINLSWSPPTDGSVIKNYIIERKSTDQSNYTKIGEVQPQFLSYSDGHLLGNTLYTYRTSAIDSKDVKSFSDLVNATTFPYVNGRGGVSDRHPPAINGINFFSMINGNKTLGFSTGQLNYYEDIPDQKMSTGVQQQLEIRVTDNSGIGAIKHVGLVMHVNYDKIKTSDTYFVYNEGEGLTIYDPLGLFENVHVYRTYTNSEMILTFLFTPQKTISITNPIINTWDAYFNSKNLVLAGAFEISQEADIFLDEIIFQDLPYYKNPQWSQIVIDAHGNMITFDSFGNLYSKPVYVNDEVVQYGTYIGKSERHDEGFYDLVSEEEVKAKEIAKILMKNPIYSEEQKVIMIHKAFPYPSNVGHMTRNDVKLFEIMMEKENIKAQKHR